MKTILVPTDFSKNSEYALNYAVELAKKENARITLLHVYHVTTYSPPEMPMEFVFEQTEAVRITSEERLRALCLKISKTKKIECDFLNELGLVVDGILHSIKKKKPIWVVMGTNGISNIKEMILGSNTARIIEKARCPVIVIPGRTVFKEIKKITYATNYNASDLVSLKEVIGLAKKFKAQVKILHISDEEYTTEYEKKVMEQFIKTVNKKISYDNLTFELIYGKNVNKKLETYTNTKSTDLFVMSTHYRNLIDKLFGNSITRKMAQHINSPLMVFHHKKEIVTLI